MIDELRAIPVSVPDTNNIRLRVLIVTYNWPPRNAIGTHRPYSWAKYWSKLGADVTVLTARKCHFDRPLDLVLPTIPGVSVVEVPFLPEPGTAAKPGDGPSVMGGLVPHLKSIRSRVEHWLGLTLDPRDRWAKAARSRAEAMGAEFDVVVSTFGPRAAHVLASDMKRAHPNLLWIADYRDLWSQNPLRKMSRRSRLRERRKEMQTMRVGADLVTTVSEELADSLNDLLGTVPFVVENGFDIDAATLQGNLERVPEHSSPCLEIVYTGLVTPDRYDLSPLFSALSVLAAEGRIRKGDVRLNFYGSRQEWLTELAALHGSSEFVKLHGHVDRDTALQVQRDAGALLLLASSADDAKGVLTGKLFEYMSAGVPILSLGSQPGSAIARMLSRCGSGICLGTEVQAIRAALLELKRGRPQWFTPRVDEISQYSRENQARRLFEAISRLASASNDGA